MDDLFEGISLDLSEEGALDAFIDKLNSVVWSDLSSMPITDYDQDGLNGLLYNFSNIFWRENRGLINGNYELDISEEDILISDIKKYLIELARKEYLAEFHDECSNIVNLVDGYGVGDNIKELFLTLNYEEDSLIEEKVQFMRELYFDNFEEEDYLYFSEDEINIELDKFREMLRLFFVKIKLEKNDEEDIKELKGNI